MKKTDKQVIFICLIFCTVLLLTSCVTISNDQRIDNFPMYGQPEIPRPEHMKELDEAFIKKAAAGFGGDRKEASKAWAAVAHEFISKDNLHYAMRRYNQSWLLNPDNYQPYWGFGRILLARGKADNSFDESIKYFEKAKELIDDKYQEVALLADAGVAYSYKADSISKDLPQERARYFGIANKHFKESTIIDPTLNHSWRQWAYSLFREGDYKKVWEKVKVVRSLGDRPFPETFLKSLNMKFPEPK